MRIPNLSLLTHKDACRVKSNKSLCETLNSWKIMCCTNLSGLQFLLKLRCSLSIWRVCISQRMWVGQCSGQQGDEDCTHLEMEKELEGQSPRPSDNRLPFPKYVWGDSSLSVTYTLPITREEVIVLITVLSHTAYVQILAGTASLVHIPEPPKDYGSY